MKVAIPFISLFSPLVLASDCSFEHLRNDFVIKRAGADAKQSFKAKGFSFIAVANGLAPARPGFEHIHMSACIILKTKWDVLWVGSDTSNCSAYIELEEHAIAYSRVFNEKMIGLAKLSEKYICANDLQSKLY
ncbi:hypothetical protein [Pseudoalteromonas sp. H71]|uniref:hypothetical protein n=1 Tax=Pseudoalteromonas sp. H71 TaxID=1348395 RepID=UPI000730F834|nr:hypothetical protein [Pseudoalteromonas sp. H71]KTD98218.1 hypothetical protein ATS71_13415 [Pseudoalteromonas sp. H71]